MIGDATRLAELFQGARRPVVFPAASIPVHAKHGGATLVIVNLAPTPLDARADFVIRGKAGPVMSEVLARMALA